ncbi:MAG: L-threonylcarbamoyladenylate synthase, partial [Woeseiaceae bacterium]
MNPSIQRAADTLLGGGVIAYPTEGVFGLGCLPDDRAAIRRLLAIKRRDPAKGLILIAASAEQFDGWIDETDLDRLPEPDPAQPVTWVATPGQLATPLVTGAQPGLAVRITTNPVARDICVAVELPIVSTSANLSGRPVARNRFVLRRTFSGLVDYMVPGD